MSEDQKSLYNLRDHREAFTGFARVLNYEINNEYRKEYTLNFLYEGECKNGNPHNFGRFISG